jgi:DNA helicase II / ATP-dependent DNA helicase PcrA
MLDRMPGGPHREHLEELLEGLNEPQREAVTHGEGPLLILAGAGSGKTRVLTHRVAYLIFTDQAQPSEILAITFTNKAAQEMRGRAQQLLGHDTRGMWLMTFHAACARILRSEAPRLGYTRQFTIYDQADARRLTKRCIDELSIDSKRFTPAALHSQISAAKNRLSSADEYRQAVGSPFEEVVGDVYDLYERELLRMNAMDFDDLLLRTVNVLELFEEVRVRYTSAFAHVLVDEYQDTNHAQYRLLQLLVGGGREAPARGRRVQREGHRNLAVVGDDSQCLVGGTLVTMGDGTRRPIERVHAGDRVLSCYGSGDLRPATVARTHRSRCSEGVAIALRGGRRIVSTPEHTHFAGYRTGSTPQMHLTYLMRHRDKGLRVGTSRVYTGARDASVVGVALRTHQESADAAWIVGTHETEMDALDTSAAGKCRLADQGLELEHPHFMPASFEGRRRVVTVTLCADRRGRTPMHLVAVGGRDPEARAALAGMGLNVRSSKAGSRAWRYESVFKDFSAVMAIVARIRSVLPVRVRCQARLGAQSDALGRNTLPFIPAASVRPGMVMFTEDSAYDIVEHVERVRVDGWVYDLDVEATHNFIAEGVITHNSIYSFRGADVRNILDFQDDFPDARVIKLEQNYRSTQTILSAANAVITNNRGGIAKRLWSDLGSGSPVHVRELDDEHAEARFVVGEIERLVDEGASRAEIAVLYRTNAMSRVIEDTLVRREIAYQVIGGTKFYERAEIKDAIAYLSWLANPFDVVSFTRIANSPRRGLGQTSLGRVIAHAASVGESVWDTASAPQQIPGLGAAAVKSLARFMATMTELAELVAERVPVGDLLDAVLSRSGYLDALEAETMGGAEKTIEAQGRIENLEQLVEVAREFDASASEQQDTLDVFLQQLALVADADARRDDESLVTLMTLHNAKGLEYPLVFIAGCEDGVFPHSRALDEGSLEEERRLFYVGVTRAMRELYLTHARRRSVFGAPTYGLPSRFLAEIPDDLTDVEDELVVSRASGVAVGVGAGASWDGASGGRATSRAGARHGPSSAVAGSLRMGQDVVHAAFGEGVVTGLEPGGVIVVRFAADGSERKLMAEYAPISGR